LACNSLVLWAKLQRLPYKHFPDFKNDLQSYVLNLTRKRFLNLEFLLNLLFFLLSVLFLWTNLFEMSKFEDFEIFTWSSSSICGYFSHYLDKVAKLRIRLVFLFLKNCTVFTIFGFSNVEICYVSTPLLGSKRARRLFFKLLIWLIPLNC